MAFFILCASKKSVSAHQLHRMLGITYKTAWFMAHRIRFALGPKMPMGKLLTGTWKWTKPTLAARATSETKVSRKTPVVALIERNGDMYTRVVSNVTQKNLRAAMTECVDRGATLNTDDSGVYGRTAEERVSSHVRAIP